MGRADSRVVGTVMLRRRRVGVRTTCAVLFGAALVLRLFYLFEARENPFFQGLGLDARYYDLRAGEILSEGLIGDDAYFMGPLYPHLLAVVYAVAGRSLLLVRLLQAIVSALAPVLVYRLGRRFFSPATALVAGLITAFHGQLIFYCGSILYTTVAVTLILWILVRLTEPSPRRTKTDRFLTGVLFGLAAVGKGNIVLFLPVALVVAARGARRGRPWNIAGATALLAGFLLVVAGVTARNYAASGDFVPLTSNGGLNFYIGNGPESSGAYEKPKGLDVDNDPSGRRMLEKALGRSLKPTDVSRIWTARALEFIRDDPAAEMKLLLRKSLFVISTFEIPQIESYHFQRRYSRLIDLLFIPFGVIAPLAAAGMIGRRRDKALPLAAFVVVYSFSIVLFFVLTRYRLPVVPVLILYASSAVRRALSAMRRREWPVLAKGTAIALPAFLLCNINFYSISPDTGDAQSHYRLGIIRNSEGKREEAVREYRKSIELDPNYARSRLNLGGLLAMGGDVKGAEEMFRSAVRLDPDYPKARLNLGTLLYRTGRLSEGEAELRKAIRLDPAYGKAWLHLAAAGILSGNGDAPEYAGRAAALLGPESAEGALAVRLRARAAEIGRLEKWRAQRATGAKLPPASREAVLADLFQDRENVEGLYREGAATGDAAALYLFGAYLMRHEGYAEAEAVLSRAVDVGDDLPGLHYAKGVLAMKKGDTAGAYTEFLRETKNDPMNLPAWKNAAVLASRSGLPDEGRRLAEEYVRRGGVKDESVEALLR